MHKVKADLTCNALNDVTILSHRVGLPCLLQSEPYDESVHSVCNSADDTETAAKDSDVIQGITCEVGFHLVHDVGVETLSVVQLEGLG